MDGLSKLWLKEIAHRCIWISMMLLFLAVNASVIVGLLAREGAWIGAIALALPASWIWARCLRNYAKANRILSYLERKSPTLS